MITIKITSIDMLFTHIKQWKEDPYTITFNPPKHTWTLEIDAEY